MTLHGTLKQERISWRSVGAMSAVLVTFAVMTALLWPQPERLQMPPRIVETPEPFAPSAAFEAANDLAVLQAVLDKRCKADTIQVLSSKPDDYIGTRSSHRPGTFPDGLGCPGIRIIDSGELDALFSKPFRGKRDFKHQGGWGNFYDAYPEASGVLTLSLPSYPTAASAVVKLGATCGRLCGSGWEVTLAKVGGKWVVREHRPTWIA